MTMNSLAARVPCTIVTGFLGAGKTTLIRHVLANAQGRRLAVIVNEFGDVGIDGEILKGCGDAACPEENIVELANGCLCCTVADEFVPALDTDSRRASRAVEHIVIETSGLALPKPLVQAFHWPAIKSRVTVDGVVAVVDGAALAEGRLAADPRGARAPARRRRLARSRRSGRGSIRGSDRLRRSRRAEQARFVDAAGADKAPRWSSGALPRAVKIVPVADGKVDPAALLGLGVGTEDDIENRRTRHDAELEHDHDDFDSFVRAAAEISDPAGLAARIARWRMRKRRFTRQRFCRGRGQADASARAGGRRAGHASLRSAWDAPKRKRRAARRHWHEGTRPPAVSHGRCSDERCICSRPPRLPSTTSSKPSICASRPETSSILSFADSDLSGLAAAWAAQRTVLPSVRLANLRDLRHPHVGRPLGRRRRKRMPRSSWCACSEGSTGGVTASSGCRRLRAKGASCLRCSR